MPRERHFDIDGLSFAAQEWGEMGEAPVLALHGWLDNSASFDALAARLKGFNLLALDLAGHGKSGHRPGSTPYNIWEDVAEIFALADHLEWERFTLLGHSRGAIISVLAAGTFPERIDRLALIEGLWPEPQNPADAPEQLARSILEGRALTNRPLTLYPDYESATMARERGMFPLSKQAASVLTERGLKKVEGGFCWSTDQRLLAPAAVKLTQEHVQAFSARISAPIKLILGEDGIPKLFPRYTEALPMFPNLDLDVVPGGHHLHMEQEVDSVADMLQVFLNDSIR